MSATYGTVTIGRLTLRETFTLKADVHASHGERTITITGEESSPPLTSTQLKQRHEDMMTMRDMVMPITWTNKSDHDGFYVIDDISAEVTNWTGAVLKLVWSIRAVRIGPDNSAEIESRLTSIARQNDFNLAGEVWHAPAIGHYAYFTGTTQPATTTNRVSTDGTIATYRDVPDDVNPRWSVPVAQYTGGRARLLVDGVERTGTNVNDGADWDLNNGLLNVSPAASGGLLVEAYDGSQFEGKTWNLSVGASATPVGTWTSMAVLRNDFEMVTVRLLKTRAPVGRITLDLSLRRGSRFVEGYLETDTSTTLAAYLSGAENATIPASGGYSVATSNDGAGNKAIVGTSRTFTGNTNNVRLHKTTTTALDFFLGSVVGGSGAQTGDAAADLMDQYIGAPAEITIAVRR